MSKILKSSTDDIRFEASLDSDADLENLVTPQAGVLHYPAPVVIRLEAAGAINFTELVRAVAHRLNSATCSVAELTAALDEARAALKQLVDESTLVVHQDGNVSVPSGTKVECKMSTFKEAIVELSRTQRDTALALDEIVRYHGGDFETVTFLGTLTWRFPCGGWVGIDMNGLQPEGWFLLRLDHFYAGCRGMKNWDDPRSGLFGHTLENMEKAVRFAAGVDR